MSLKQFRASRCKHFLVGMPPEPPSKFLPCFWQGSSYGPDFTSLNISGPKKDNENAKRHFKSLNDTPKTARDENLIMVALNFDVTTANVFLK